MIIEDIQNGQTIRNGFNGSHHSAPDPEEKHAVETSTAALTMQAQTEVQARFFVAMQRPRDLKKVRAQLMQDCKRPAFAGVARYNKPVGGGIEGPSIRFVEAALQWMRNVEITSKAVFDDERRRVVRVTVTDLQENASFSQDVTVPKFIERSKSYDRQVVGKRSNGHGQSVFTVVATDDEIRQLEGALISKAIRGCGLRIIPRDIVDDCMEEVSKTMGTRDPVDPTRGLKHLSDAFAEMGVMPDELARYCGVPLEQISDDEVDDLRDVYVSIRDGLTTWRRAMSERRGAQSSPPSHSDIEGTGQMRSEDKRTIDDIIERIRAANGLPELMSLAREIKALPASAHTAAVAEYKARKKDLQR